MRDQLTSPPPLLFVLDIHPERLLLVFGIKKKSLIDKGTDQLFMYFSKLIDVSKHPTILVVYALHKRFTNGVSMQNVLSQNKTWK